VPEPTASGKECQQRPEEELSTVAELEEEKDWHYKW
jgi:hypothetical protein